MKEKISEQIPAELDFYEAFELEDEDTQTLRSAYGHLTGGLPLLPGMIAALFLAGILIAFYPRNLLRWFGITSIVAGAIAGLLHLAPLFFGRGRLTAMIPNGGGNGEPAAGSEIAGMLAFQLFVQALPVVLTVTIAAVLIGVAALIIRRTAWLQRGDSAMRRRLAERKILYPVLRACGAVLPIGVWVIAAFQFYSSVALS